MSGKLIGLIGSKESGKTTVANYLQKKYDAKVVALADKLKQVCSKVFEIPLSHFDLQEFKEVEFESTKNITIRNLDSILSEYGIFGNRDMFYTEHVGTSLKNPRHIAQYVGTEILRSYDQDIHLKHISLSSKNTVVSDVRFVSEYEYLLNKDAVFFYIKRTSAENKITESSHPSEKESQIIKNMNRVIIINNDSSLDETYNQINKVMGLLNET